MSAKIHIESEQEVTIDFVVREASRIWRRMRSARLPPGDMVAANAFMDRVRPDHQKFCQAYPIVFRYICQMQQYSARAFRLWLMKIKEHPWTSEEGYLEAQAEYAVMLYRDKKPRAPMSEYENLRANIHATLSSEHKKFKELVGECEKRVIADENILRARNADELYEFARVAGPAGIGMAETVRVEILTGCTPAELPAVEIHPAPARADDLLG